MKIIYPWCVDALMHWAVLYALIQRFALLHWGYRFGWVYKMYTCQHWQKVCRRRGLCTCGHGLDSPGCRCCMASPLLLLLLALLAPLLLLALPCTAAAVATSCCWHCSELLLSLLPGPPAPNRTDCCCCLKSLYCKFQTRDRMQQPVANH